jgi:hypothetical protein
MRCARRGKTRTLDVMEAAIGLAAIVALIATNIGASRLVVRDDLSERAQKVAQLAAVWLLPIVGAIVVFAVHRKDEPPSRKYREEPDPGDGFDYTGRVARPGARPDMDGPD